MEANPWRQGSVFCLGCNRRPSARTLTPRRPLLRKVRGMQHVELSLAGGVAILRLNVPGSLNALSLAVLHDMAGALDRVEMEAHLAALIITGTGEAFSAGADLRELQAHQADLRGYATELASLAHHILARISRLLLPSIAAVNGVVAGGGLGLLLACDLAVAAEHSRFLAGYQNVGLTPDAGTTYWLPRLVGIRRANELLLTHRTLTGEEALRWGLVNAVVPDECVLPCAERWAADLVAGPRLAQAGTKRLLGLARHGNTLSDQMAAEQTAVIHCLTSEEGAEGIEAFVSHRPPMFTPLGPCSGQRKT